ncbi:hypothetical protein [Litchfieldia alkalitelluris]|uniref:hypothetical protein n=1 Tax=Litchfieldia alkalitelluris TaxID=304268 RepID=UPI001474B2D1|nr:hypothetical protein [Litchfieldia alkalitelluris]
MSEYTGKEVHEIEQAAIKDDHNAKKARAEVDEATAHMNVQRQYSEDLSQNKR